MPYYHVNDDFSKAQGIDNKLDRFIINYFHESIDNNKDWIIAISLLVYWNWQMHDKIHW